MKRFLSLALAILMVLCCASTRAYATKAEQVEVYTFEINADSGEIILPRGVYNEIDQTFNMTTYHRGADRTYTGSNLRYSVTITDGNGNPVDNTVRVDLCDYNYGAISSKWVPANGGTYGEDVPIVSGRVYYFTYTKTAGTTRTLRVNMYIYSHD